VSEILIIPPSKDEIEEQPARLGICPLSWINFPVAMRLSLSNLGKGIRHAVNLTGVCGVFPFQKSPGLCRVLSAPAIKKSLLDTSGRWEYFMR
jgi:hypothetical protein